MNVRDVLVLYVAVGVGCAVAALRRAAVVGPRAALSAAANVLLWPLWAPFALAPRAVRGGSPQAARTSAGPAPHERERIARIDKALDDAVAAVAGSAMADAFSRAVASRIAAEVRAIAARLHELETAASGHDAAAAARRVHELEQRAAPERTIATARLQYESLLRLEQLRAADAQALDELAELLEALRTQLLLARYSGASTDGVGALVSEVWARLEGLGAAFEPTPTAH